MWRAFTSFVKMLCKDVMTLVLLIFCVFLSAAVFSKTVKINMGAVAGSCTFFSDCFYTLILLYFYYCFFFYF